MAQMKERYKTPEKELNGDKHSIRCTVQNTGYQDTPGTQWVLQKHKKDPGNNEGCIK